MKSLVCAIFGGTQDKVIVPSEADADMERKVLAAVKLEKSDIAN